MLRGAGARLAITDGPYIESKEVIGGFCILEATSYEQAVEPARGPPDLEWRSIEVREIETT